MNLSNDPEISRGGSPRPPRPGTRRHTTLLELSWALVRLLGDDRRAVDVTTELIRQGRVRTVDGRILALEPHDRGGDAPRAKTP